ncbi:F-box domain containing protein [Parasponia andersonii]|uniref:F-box domain containing protein n=1 Tax=Parasponia andersonii TaxID=3476 RepID=A0A2P5DEB3_PARAD|nr:F-box domain containing protein [Parasponia andersonii]
MASSSTEFSPVESSPEEERRNWVELPRDVTASILSRLGAMEILTSGQMVCKAWLEICKDPLLWRTIDMYNLGDPDLGLDLEKICRHAVDRSCGELVDINLEYFVTDELLQYITDRSNQIKRLRLACCYHASDEGLIEAIGKLPLLEELDLTLCSFSVEPLKALGRSCSHLKSLKLNCHAYRISIEDLDDEVEFNDEVITIGENLSKLRHLQLIGNGMTNMGLEAILDGCPNLESLDLRRCLNIDLKGNLGKRCAEQIKHLWLPGDSIKDYRFVADPDDGLLDEDYPFRFAGADFLLGEYLELEDGYEDADDYSYDDCGYSGGNDSLDYEDFTDYDDF